MKKREQMSYKDQAVEAAKDLGYGAAVIDRIKKRQNRFGDLSHHDKCKKK